MRRILSIMIGVAAIGSGAIAQDVEVDLSEGRETFFTYCATCHGIEARGDGPMASMLVLTPPDLTDLARQNGGTFPRAFVIARIDGRDPLLAHGSPMPVYGDYFEGRGVTMRDEGGELVMTSQPVVDLVEWLESIQN
ncbi:c-type cytochrome [Litoreibacter roseus]|uniref:Cytochrome c domain-containing protein n=1 Tax=Litoreibacter roseus TaxID=2601869 RepID=A0A6N6JIW4_9RHOB|nr:cytochrome c [Litoreibacter roseus]GFE66015.1 hypothetical protein KIN_30890 [Litoreibacter roseus]